MGNDYPLLRDADPEEPSAIDGGPGLLVERESELSELERTLREASASRGSVIVIEAPTGLGKSALLAAAADRATAAGMEVLDATASELECSFPFGVALQLFETRWASASDEERAALRGGAAGAAGALLDGRLADLQRDPSTNGYPLIHGLFWLARNLASRSAAPQDRGGLAILVDDVHWADTPSLRFLAYLAARLSNLPIALIVTIAPGEDSPDSSAASALQTGPAGTVLRLAPLTTSGVSTLVRDRFPDASREFMSACDRVTRGNPFLVIELLAQVGADQNPPDAETAARLADLAPEAIVNAVLARLGAMSGAVRKLAGAVALLGDRVPLKSAAKLAELDPETAADAADALARVQLLRPGTPLSYIHPLVRSAMLASMPPLSRGQAHRRAATILREEGAAVETVAAHLLAAPAQDDPDAVESLRLAAVETLGSGEADNAARLLERALAEQPGPDVYPDVLAELGHAEARAGLPHAPDRLEDAISVTEEPVRRAELALARGRALAAQGGYDDAAAAFDAGLHELSGSDSSLAEELAMAFISAAAQVPELLDQALSRRKLMLEQLVGKPNAGQRSVLAQTVVHDSVRGASRSSVRGLADLAWSDGALLEDGGVEGLTVLPLTEALTNVDELERAIELCDSMSDSQRSSESPRSIVSLLLGDLRARCLYEQGSILEATAGANSAVEAPGRAPSELWRARGVLGACHLQAGALDRAEAVLAPLDDGPIPDPLHHAFLLDISAQLRLAQHRPRDAVDDTIDAERILQTCTAPVSPGVVPWRSTAALAHLALGDRARGEELAIEELEQAQQIGVTRVAIRALRVLGLCAGGMAGIELLEEAVRTAKQYPLRLESIQAMIELGAALRRAKQRAAARDPLREALELSHRAGARALADRAQTELAATGVRARRVLLSGVASLTPSERRVADLAAGGMTTRQIAETLFVTPKTVEYHLRHTYRKLDIGSRGELAETLGHERAA